MPNLRDTPIETLTEADLQRLITDEIPENRQLEYKRGLWPESGDGQREFLKDLAGFANAQGGDIVVGIAETAGLPEALIGVEEVDPQGLLIALENRYRNRLEPPLAGVRMRWIPVFNGGRQALVIRIPGSLRAPHRDRQSGHFPIRGESRIDQMGIDELRDAFLGSEQLIERLRRLHLAAVDVRNRPELPFEVNHLPAVVMSMMPLDVMRAGRDLPVTADTSIRPFREGVVGAGWNIILEGIVWNGEAPFFQTFAVTHRQGRLDAFWNIGFRQPDREAGEHSPVSNTRFEDGLADLVAAAQQQFRTFGIDGPWVVMSSLIGIRGRQMGTDFATMETGLPSRRDTAHLPDVIGERIDRKALLPVFEAFPRVFGRNRRVP